MVGKCAFQNIVFPKRSKEFSIFKWQNHSERQREMQWIHRELWIRFCSLFSPASWGPPCPRPLGAVEMHADTWWVRLKHSQVSAGKGIQSFSSFSPFPSSKWWYFRVLLFIKDQAANISLLRLVLHITVLILVFAFLFNWKFVREERH